jgi:hypothetical protein
MKRLLIALLLFSIMPVFAQVDSTVAINDSSKVDVSQLVRQQIELAQAKQEMQTIQETEKQDIPERRQPQVIKRIKLASNNSSGLLEKFIFLSAAAIVIFGFVLLRRKMSEVKNKNEKNLKRNIQFLREERVMRKDNPNLKKIRFGLVNNTGIEELSEEAITYTAKKLRISREEIILANRINSYKMMNA